jgi:hypothetical protein
MKINLKSKSRFYFTGMIFLVIFFLGFFGSAKSAEAATINASSCQQPAVQTAVNSASSGDTVYVPAGNCTWNDPVTIGKGITLQGAGPASTVITGNSSNIFIINGDGGNFRLTALGITGTVWSSALRIEYNFNTCRIDHVNMTNLSYKAVTIGGDSTWYAAYPPRTIYNKQKILFDNINFSSNSGQQFLIIYSRWQNWIEDDDYGTDNFIYIEDSSFSETGGGGWLSNIDAEGGARYVFRHNTAHRFSPAMHDMGSSAGRRGNRLVEIYDNIFTCSGGGCENGVMSTRGGSGVYYNNTITGYGDAINTEIFRTAYPDDNGEHGSFVGGGHCADTGSRKICEDVQHHCTAGTKLPCYQDSDCAAGICTRTALGYWLPACTSDSDCGAGVRCMQIDGNGSPAGWPCRDQTGRGKDDPITGVQASSPLYFWNNTLNGQTAGFTNWSGSYIQENRDYCLHSPATACGAKQAWTYIPYTYPHPLRSYVSIIPICGQNGCESGETCSTCPADCGACSGEWIFCANEDETCIFSGTKEVRYGANDKYFYSTFANNVLCANSVFGDPLIGVGKSCYYRLTGDIIAPAAPVNARVN